MLTFLGFLYLILVDKTMSGDFKRFVGMQIINPAVSKGKVYQGVIFDIFSFHYYF